MGKSWMNWELEFIKSNLEKLTLEDIAKHLHRSEMSVRLYVLRKRLPYGERVKRNLLLELLKARFPHPEDFLPSRRFYNTVGIGQRRWWQLYFGREAITSEEYAAVAKYLNVSIGEALETHQLELFEEEGYDR